MSPQQFAVPGSVHAHIIDCHHGPHPECGTCELQKGHDWVYLDRIDGLRCTNIGNQNGLPPNANQTGRANIGDLSLARAPAHGSGNARFMANAETSNRETAQTRFSGVVHKRALENTAVSYAGISGKLALTGAPAPSNRTVPLGGAGPAETSKSRKSNASGVLELRSLIHYRPRSRVTAIAGGHDLRVTCCYYCLSGFCIHAEAGEGYLAGYERIDSKESDDPPMSTVDVQGPTLAGSWQMIW